MVWEGELLLKREMCQILPWVPVEAQTKGACGKHIVCKRGRADFYHRSPGVCCIRCVRAENVNAMSNEQAKTLA